MATVARRRRTAACGSGGRAVAAAQRGGVGGEIESFPHLFPCRFDEFFFYPRNFRKHVVTKNHSLTHSARVSLSQWDFWIQFFSNFRILYRVWIFCSSSPKNGRDLKRSKIEFSSLMHCYWTRLDKSVKYILFFTVFIFVQIWLKTAYQS